MIDNVDLDPASAQDRDRGAYRIEFYLPGNHGAVLITSRLATLAQIGGGRSDEQVRTVSLEVSKQIFVRWCSQHLGKKNLFQKDCIADVSQEDDEDLQNLLGPDRLCGLPLAIAQAAVYIKQNRGISIAEYVRRFDHMWPHTMSPNNEQPLHDYHAAVGITWSLSMQQVQDQSETAAMLARMWAYLDNQGFCFELLRNMPTHSTIVDLFEEIELEDWEDQDVPAWLTQLSDDEGLFHHSLQLLQKYGLAESHTAESLEHLGNGKLCYSMHPLVHRWARHMQTTEQRRAASRAAIWVNAILDTKRMPHTSKYTPHKAWLVPHARKCMAFLLDDEDLRSMVQTHLPSLLALRDTIYFLYRDPATAIPIYRLILKAGETRRLPQLHHAACLMDLSMQINQEEVEALASRVLALPIAQSGLGPMIRAWALYQHANARLRAGCSTAEVLLQDYINDVDESNNHVAWANMDLSQIHAIKGSLLLSESYSRKALFLIDKHHPDDPVLRYYGLVNLAQNILSRIASSPVSASPESCAEVHALSCEGRDLCAKLFGPNEYNTNLGRVLVTFAELLTDRLSDAEETLTYVMNSEGGLDRIDLFCGTKLCVRLLTLYTARKGFQSQTEHTLHKFRKYRDPDQYKELHIGPLRNPSGDLDAEVQILWQGVYQYILINLQGRFSNENSLGRRLSNESKA